MGRAGRRGVARLGRQLPTPQAASTDLQGAQQKLDQAQHEHELVVSLSDFGGAKSKLRLDAFLAARLPAASRARLQASIKGGLVVVNGRPQAKASHGVRPGDLVACSVLPPTPLEAAPEDLPLNIVYEDDHLMVINKAADMVMHPSPGHYSGTLVNALLHHCRLPAMQLSSGVAAPLSLEGAAAAAAAAAGAAELPRPDGSGGSGGGGQAEQEQQRQQQLRTAEGAAAGDQQQLTAAAGAAAGCQQQPGHGDFDCLQGGLLADGGAEGGPLASNDLENDDDEDGGGFFLLGPGGAAGSTAGTAGSTTIRPGIVHRLDRGTTGLLVVAKTDAAHLSLAQQFKDRTVSRTYVSITLGVPRPADSRVATNVGRDLRDRKKMAAFAYASARGRTAASNYRVLEVLAGGGAAVVQWRLETGRTHQIRVHARHIGHPLFADDTYSSPAAAASIVGAGKPARAAAAAAAVRALARPALHAKSLGFVHPATGQRLEFESELPPDFEAAARALRAPPFVAE